MDIGKSKNYLGIIYDNTNAVYDNDKSVYDQANTILNSLFMIKINMVLGDLTDVSAVTEVLHRMRYSGLVFKTK